MNAVSLPSQLVFMQWLVQVQWSSLRPTQLPLMYVELATSPLGVSMRMLIGGDTMANPSIIPGHTALPRTTTYQEIVVDNYTNLAAGYRCVPTLSNGSQLLSSVYIPQTECECYQTSSKFCYAHWSCYIASCLKVINGCGPVTGQM